MITRVGHTSLGRGGASQLHNLGLTELVAHSDRQFIQVAAELAGTFERLRGLRLSLRQRMERSSLMDGPRFAQHVEDAFRQMWRTWCATRHKVAPLSLPEASGRYSGDGVANREFTN